MKIYTETRSPDKSNIRPAENKIDKPKRLNRWTIFLFVVLSAVATVIYVSNVISIDALLKTNQDMKRMYETLKDENDVSRRKLNSLQDAGRISQIASTKLGMIKQEIAPEYILSKIKVKE
jgi:tRNA uridine 5-carbamoylmethylation protein Kti12